MSASLLPLEPFGLQVDLPPGTRWDDLDVAELRGWIDAHRVVVLRGLVAMPPEELARASRKLGPLQPWRFGAVHELKRDPDADNYLYTEREVPLHWDGAFAGTIPHFLVFRCVAAPPPEAGGETVFVDTIAALERVPPDVLERWRSARVRYTTEKKAHYGGSFTSPVLAPHPTLRVPTIRYAEPVHDLNPVEVKPLDVDAPGAASLMRELGDALHRPEVELALPWRDGDVVIADNHALLHGRRAFRADVPRHLLRVNVLDPERRFWWGLRDSWRIRRPEYMRAEIPILLIPAMISAQHPADLLSVTFAEGAALFFLLFNIGDMVNCLLDQEVDLHRKTHLAEAVRALGDRNVKAQIAVSAVVAAALGVHVALTLGRAWMGAAGLVGGLLAASYTAPPLRLKSRGLLQVAAQIALLSFGPMLMVAGLFVAWPTPTLIAAALAYGSMQVGVLLVNNAEDMDEDEREGIRTASLALGAAGAMRFARGLALAGGLGYSAVVLVATSRAWALVLLAPLLVILVYNERWLRALGRATSAVPESFAREAIRKQGKHVPRHVEAGALAAAIAALAVLLARPS